MGFNYQKICLKTLENTFPREKKVLLRRFGLENNQQETLQKIGDDFGITRERVRQIERDGFSKMAGEKNKAYLKIVFSHFNDTLSKHGGLKREDVLLAELGKDRFQNHVYFLLTLGEPFYRFSESDNLYSFWTNEKDISKKVQKIVNTLFQSFKKKKNPLTEEGFLALNQNERPELFLSSFEVAKKIEKGPLGKFGLVEWSEIKPKGVRDKAYLALKKTEKPLHFTEIAKIASNIKGDFFDEKPVLPQTVHNELIRDKRFVLVGRGMYALTDWGYNAGTVKEIIAGILKKNKKPMLKQEILKKVQEQRLVKENTISLNLADKGYFEKDNQGRYIIKKI